MEFPNFFSGNIGNGVLGSGFRGEETMAYAAVEAFARLAVVSAQLDQALRDGGAGCFDTGVAKQLHGTIGERFVGTRHAIGKLQRSDCVDDQ